MNMELAIRLTEILLGLAFIQQSAEHLRGHKNEQRLFLPRLGLSVLLVLGVMTPLRPPRVLNLRCLKPSKARPIIGKNSAHALRISPSPLCSNVCFGTRTGMNLCFW